MAQENATIIQRKGENSKEKDEGEGGEKTSESGPVVDTPQGAPSVNEAGVVTNQRSVLTATSAPSVVDNDWRVDEKEANLGSASVDDGASCSTDSPRLVQDLLQAGTMGEVGGVVCNGGVADMVDGESAMGRDGADMVDDSVVIVDGNVAMVDGGDADIVGGNSDVVDAPDMVDDKPVTIVDTNTNSVAHDTSTTTTLVDDTILHKAASMVHDINMANEAYLVDDKPDTVGGREDLDAASATEVHVGPDNGVIGHPATASTEAVESSAFGARTPSDGESIDTVVARSELSSAIASVGAGAGSSLDAEQNPPPLVGEIAAVSPREAGAAASVLQQQKSAQDQQQQQQKRQQQHSPPPPPPQQQQQQQEVGTGSLPPSSRPARVSLADAAAFVDAEGAAAEQAYSDVLQAQAVSEAGRAQAALQATASAAAGIVGGAGGAVNAAATAAAAAAAAAATAAGEAFSLGDRDISVEGACSVFGDEGGVCRHIQAPHIVFIQYQLAMLAGVVSLILICWRRHGSMISVLYALPEDAGGGSTPHQTRTP